MSDEFSKWSKTIANDFLQSIVFVDDRAFLNPGAHAHEFDARQISQVFANSQKVCAVYNPETKADIENFALLAKKADVTVLDWQILIKDTDPETIGGEEDVIEDDPRGAYALKIIREILSDPLTGKGSLKLILIFTGETDLPGITDEIFKDLQDQNIEGLKQDFCSLLSENIRIVVIAKPDSPDKPKGDKFKHNPQLAEKIVPYEELPEFILGQFTEMTSGLLTNFVLQSLTVIRKNTFRLIKLYNKKLDPSFLANRLLLENQDDAAEQLVEMLSHSILALMSYQDTGLAVSSANIIKWIENGEFNQKLPIKDREILLDGDFLKEWVNLGFVEACKKYWIAKAYSTENHTPDKIFEGKKESLFEHGSKLIVGESGERLDEEFSILTHHKSNLKQPSILPRLSLGTIIKQIPKKLDEQPADVPPDESVESYFLCIQPRCDSVRLEGLRKFMFLPLIKVTGGKFQFIVEDEGQKVKLKINKDAFELRTIKFSPTNGQGVVIAQETGGHLFFESNHKEQYRWLADLKDSHAQREVNKFAAKISRVGLGESEWLRKWSPTT